MMRRRMRHTTQKSQHTERWLVSYADYMTIMFAFFVVMYAIAISKNEDFQILSDSLEQVFEKSARKQEQAGTGVNGTGILTDRVTPENDILYGESIRKDEQGPELLDGQSETSNIDK
ncbi:flagellar motor protein MotB, partial [Pseudoalteromonas lipolytica]